MYLNFYGLNEKPFNSTPDPRFLYLSPGHREALAQLQYGTQERKGFMVLTGKVGTGKTTVLQALHRRLEGDTAVSYVFHSTMPFDGILEYVLEDLGITKPEESQVRRLIALNNFLIERERAGQNTSSSSTRRRTWTRRRWSKSACSRTSRPPPANSCRSCWWGSPS
jgi:general secretion pathway protein A